LEVAGPLRGRLLNDLRTSQFAKLMRILRSSKIYPAALVAPPCLEEVWRPAFEPGFTWRNKKREVVAQQKPGFVLQDSSLLGWTLSPSAIDAALIPPSKSHLAEGNAPEWTELRRVSRQRTENLQRGTQMKVTAVQGQTSELADVMLRAGDAPRTAVLNWLGAFLSSAEPRGKQGYVAPEGFNFWPQFGNHVIDVLGHAQTPPFEKSLKNLLLLQAMHARIHGFPTSGAALNAFTLLLHLAKPIQLTAANTLSPYFGLRTDSGELLGSWQAESRFGEAEQLETATKAAGSDDGFTKAPSDKALFKTQVFWLASKGIGTLLLPVAKEAFHTFQGCASAFYEKDPAISETAWREFLLTESILREGSFLERLGHLINLTFHFFLHAAAGGQSALPPPEPGPLWYALPSTMLENIIELLDLYRDRTTQRKGNGIPTGLFAHLDPDAVLSTLCIVMASDSHVRDPSLRGRAVKLMHRLCFAFPSWQTKLNQNPLVKHFTPVLVAVFTAVEKAILSYYDLSYRYKYELRVPVMDLFDLALQHEEHRQVLDTFAKGVGRERFLKLLTQLIGDSNSQIEEAIKTLKDYREHSQKEKEKEAARARGVHDEEVMDDDVQGDEDVYRRSRMNYKEHAKKYFGLASRTWKQLWLLCKHEAQVIVESGMNLEQLLHTSLDAQLDGLVGKGMKKIKVDGEVKDYEELGFNPGDLVKQVAEIYLFLVRVNRIEVMRIVAKDERYYSSQTFSKAVRFIRKYNLLKSDDMQEFDAFTRDLAEMVSQQRAAFDEADIPENYLCEMMADIMSDPVMFPQSRKVVDRCNAMRQIMGNDKDPYSNTPVKYEDLIPLPELKEEIHKFAKEKNIKLEG